MVTVFIPTGSIINFLFVYPEPPSKTLIDLKVLVSFAFLNLWNPCVLVFNPTVLIPAVKSAALVKTLIVLLLTISGKYTELLVNVPPAPVIIALPLES